MSLRYLLIPTLTPETLRNLSPQAAKLLLLFCQVQVKPPEFSITVNAPTLAHYTGSSSRSIWRCIAELLHAGLLERLPRTARNTPNRYRLALVNHLPVVPPVAQQNTPVVPPVAQQPNAARPGAPENAPVASPVSLQQTSTPVAPWMALQGNTPDFLNLARSPSLQHLLAILGTPQTAFHPETAPRTPAQK